jgi:uncharacterized protein YndB with AHSA1/START domain
MSDVQASITIRRPIADVFTFVADARNIPRWHVDTAEVHLLSGDGREVGSRVLDVIQTANGRRMEARVEITRHEPDRLWAFSAALGSLGGFDGCYRFEPVPAGTHVTFTEDLRLRGVYRLLRPLLRRQVGQTARQNFARLRALLEEPTSVAT